MTGDGDGKDFAAVVVLVATVGVAAAGVAAEGIGGFAVAAEAFVWTEAEADVDVAEVGAAGAGGGALDGTFKWMVGKFPIDVLNFRTLSLRGELRGELVGSIIFLWLLGDKVAGPLLRVGLAVELLVVIVLSDASFMSVVVSPSSFAFF